MSGATYFLGAGAPSAWFPPGASSNALGLDGAFAGILTAAVFAVVLVVGLAVAFVVQFRRREGHMDAAVAGGVNPVLLGLWLVAAVTLAGFAFTADFGGYLDRSVPPYGADVIEVVASGNAWSFTYPDGVVADTLHVAVDQAVVLNVNADTARSLFIPALRINEGVLPGRPIRAWFTAEHPDTFELSDSAAGAAYADMRTALIVHGNTDYETWLQSVSDIFEGRTLPEVGELLYGRKGCMACHSLDGSKLVGPSFLDMYGNTFATREGVDVTVDAPYVRESILTPNVSIIAGFEPVMTPFEGNITDREIEAVTEWLKTLSSFAAAEQEGS